MDTKWNAWENQYKNTLLRGLGCTCFFLGVNLLLFVMYWGAYTWHTGDFYGVKDPLRENYQNTEAFRTEIAKIYTAFLDAAAGRGDQSVFETYKDQENLIFMVMRDGRRVDSNSSLAVNMRRGYLPAGYSWSLYFDGEKAHLIWSSAYSEGKVLKPWQWELPGYDGTLITQEDKGTRLYMAAADYPVSAVEGADPIYEVSQTVFWTSRTVLNICGAASILLFSFAFLLRKALLEAARSIAGRTKSIWGEGKVLLILILPVMAWVSAGKLNEIVQFGWQDNSDLRNYLVPYLVVWLAFFLANDLAWNKLEALKNWLIWNIRVRIRAAFLRLPMRTRIFRRELARLTVLLLFVALALALSAYMFHYFSASIYRDPALRLVIALFLGTVFVLLLLQVLTLCRCVRESEDLLALLEQIEQVHIGTPDAPIRVPPDTDLYSAAEQLASLQTGLEKAIAERMQSERMKVELIANVSHDLKTPLTSIMSYGALLEQETGLPDHVRAYIEILNRKAERLNTMVREVFEVSKAASGELNVHLEPLDLGKLLRQTLADLNQTVEESGLIVKVSLPETPVSILADGDRLYRVFQNLIDNAIQYALADSRVYVTLGTGGGQANAQVKNTSRDELPEPFDFTARFTRGDTSRTDGGSGLGLAIASAFTDACGGVLEIHTDADLFTVEVSFPLLDDPLPAPDPQQPEG